MNRRANHIAAAVFALLALGLGLQPARAQGEIQMRYSYATYGFSPSQRFTRPSGVFYDTNRGELYVADTGNSQIVILDKKGIPTAKIPHFVVDPTSKERHPGEPRSVVVRKNGDILVVDNMCDYIDVLDFRGRSVQKVWPGDLVGRPKGTVKPICLAMDPAGNVYVGVAGNGKEILVLAPDLSLKAQMGVESTGESKSVTGLWADKAGRVYATYAMGVCVRVYAPDGQVLTSFGGHDSGPQNFSLPSGLVTDGSGRIWAVDALRHVVSVFRMTTEEGALTSTFVSLAIGGLGQAAGDLTYPTAIAGDGAGRLFVVESTGARVQGFEIVPPSDAAKPS